MWKKLWRQSIRTVSKLIEGKSSRSRAINGLTHYTHCLQAAVGILNNGFAWVPNRRNLMSQLVPDHDFSKREPQEFGMISFTDWSPPAPVRHRKEFGDFGIVVSLEWASAEKPCGGLLSEQTKGALRAQRVIYIPEEGPVAVALRWLYTTAHDNLRKNIEYPDDAFAQMAFTNKSVAGIEGGLLWANLLTLYEYLEPERNAWQSEWRIAQPLPLYGYPPSKAEIIRAVSPPEGWAKYTRVLRAPDEAITGFVCPRQDEIFFEKPYRGSFPQGQ